jgi:hypothetical protein
MRLETTADATQTAAINNMMTGHQGRGGDMVVMHNVGTTNREQIMSITDYDLSLMNRQQRRMVKKARAYWAKR